jgi:hypothetical protein
MLSFLHSKRVGHDLLVLAVLMLEVFFAWRSSLMYVFILASRVNPVELEVVRWLVFVAVGVFGFALAVHRHAGVQAIRNLKREGNGLALAGIFGAVVVVVGHDLASVIYTVGQVDTIGAGVAVVGMCCLTLLPFLCGYMSHAIAAGITEENAQRASMKIAAWKQQAELRYWKAHYKEWQPETDLIGFSARAESDPLASNHHLAVIAGSEEANARPFR